MSVPTQVTPVGQRPVTESRAQVEATGFLDRLYGRSVVCPDGNKAWKAAAEARCIEVQSVAHQVKNFASVGPVRWKTVSNVAGTQVIDRSWKSLNFFLPQHMCLKYKRKVTARCTPVCLSTYICGLGWNHKSKEVSSCAWVPPLNARPATKNCRTQVVTSNPKTLKINFSLR